MRTAVTKNLATKFATVEEAEEAYGLGVDSYLCSPINNTNPSPSSDLSANSLLLHLASLTLSQCFELAQNIVPKLTCAQLVTLCSLISTKLTSTDIIRFISDFVSSLPFDDSVSIIDALFCQVSSSINLLKNSTNFISHSLQAMQTLQINNKPNMMYMLARVLSEKQPNGKPLLRTDRMPFGLIQYQIEFFNSTHINQVRLFPQ